MFIKNILLAISLFLSQSLIANDFYYGEFLSKFHSMDSSTIRKTLRLITSGYHYSIPNAPDLIFSNPQKGLGPATHYKPLGYKKMRTALNRIGTTFSHNLFHVNLLYCNNPYTSNTPLVNSNLDKTARTPINAEHIYPQSRFYASGNKPSTQQRVLSSFSGKPNGKKNDLHNLRLAMKANNSTRGNYRFAEVSNEKTIPETQVIIDNLNKSPIDGTFGVSLHPQASKTEIVFEPPEKSRGPIARAIIYFAIKNNLPIDPVEFFYLKKWAEEYSPSEAEKFMNEEFFKLQGNRNPLVDLEWLIELITEFPHLSSY